MAFSRDVNEIDSEDPTLLDLSVDSRPPPRSFIRKILHWIYTHKSTLIVLYILLLSEAVRGITIPSQSGYVESVRTLLAPYRTPHHPLNC